MARRPGIALVVALLVALGVAAFWFTRDANRESPQVVTPRGAPGADVAAGAREQAVLDGRRVVEKKEAGDAKPPDGAPPREAGAPKPPHAGTLLLRGRLLDGEGKPIAGAKVRAVDANPWPGTGARPAVTSAADGTFAIPDLPSGAYQIWSDAGTGDHLVARFVTAGLDPVDLKPLAPTPPMREGPKGPSVRVVDADGKPVAKADVLVKTGPGFAYLEVTDGAFFRVPENVEKQGTTYEVFGARTADGTRLPFGPAPYAPPSAPGEDEVVHLPAGLSIEGRVVGPDGAGVFGADVSASPVDPSPKPGFSAPTAHGRAVTDAEGRFTLLGLRDGPYRIVALPLPPHLEAAVPELRAGARALEVRLEMGAEALLTVVDADGAPVGGATATVFGGAMGGPIPRGRAPQVTDAAGRATFSQLDPAAKYNLMLRPPTSRADVGPYSDAKWLPEPATIRLPRAWRLQGVAKKPDGSVAAMTQVWRLGADGRWNFAALTNKAGVFEIRDLPAGPWTIATLESGWLGIEATVSDASAEVSLVHDISRKAQANAPR